MKLDSFKASTSWLDSFKKNNRIVSRRTTKWISYRHNTTREEIEQAATVFHVDLVDTILGRFTPNQIFNTDQTGYQYEMSRDRTLDHVGVKQVAVQVMNQFSTAHSYTVQPLISMAGKLLPKLMIVLQEKDGKFGPRVYESLLKPPNCFITCSRSGKVELPILRNWTINCLVPYIGDQACLIVNSYSSHRDREVFQVQGKEIQVKINPPGATPILQPLDVFFFRQWKSFSKKFTDRVLLDNLPIQLHNRNNIIKLHALIHNQFSPPKFEAMIKFASKKSGFPVEVEMFDHPDNVIFDTLLESCGIDDCNLSSFIQCSWCGKHFCVKHFFAINPPHFHNPEQGNQE